MWDTRRFRHRKAAREALVVEDDDYWKVVMDIRKKKHNEEIAATNHRWDTRVQPWLDVRLKKRPTTMERQLYRSRREFRKMELQRVRRPPTSPLAVVPQAGRKG
jgi:hypothetical protein